MTRARDLRWDGCVNIRDLGGLPLAGGGETRRRVLVRGDDVTRLSPEGRNALRRYGVLTVVDLRCPSEGESLDGATRVPVFQFDDAEFVAAMSACEDHGEYYVLLLERLRPRFAEVFETLARAPEATLFHCAAGRDRTGLVAALALLLVGAREDAIIQDYLESRAALRRRYEQLVPTMTDEEDLEALDDLLRLREEQCHEAHLRAALDHIAGEYGSAAGYLRGGGADPRALDTITARLTA